MTTPRIALIGGIDQGILRAAGWHVTGALHLTPYDDPGDVPSYADIDELLESADLDAVALDGSDDLLARHLPLLLEHGLHVLLTTAAPLDLDLLRAARAVGEEDAPTRLVHDVQRPARSGLAPAETAVSLLQRWEPWALTAAAACQVIGTPVVQATVRGWPRGVAAAAELVDLARSWCGDIVSVSAAPAQLPATELAPGIPISWVLLHDSGAATLVSHEAAPPLVRLSFATARLEAGPLGARWQGGSELPLLPTPDRRDLDGPEVLRAATPPGTSAGQLATAVALRQAVRTSEIPTDSWPWPADLGDLQAASRVLAALRDSARRELPLAVT